MRYLVAVDGSEESHDALAHAVETAATAGAVVEIVHAVVPQVETVEGERVVESTEEASDRGETVLGQARESVDEDVPVETTLVYGRPGDAIAAHADETGVDQVFVGHRGLRIERQDLVGSVAKRLVDRVDVPITIVR